MGTTGTKYVLYWGVGVRQWVPRVPSILLLCECFCNGYHGYQVYPVLGCGVAIYGYHGYQVYFFCVSVFVMGTTGTKYVLHWGVGERFMGTTGTKYTSSVWIFL